MYISMYLLLIRIVSDVTKATTSIDLTKHTAATAASMQQTGVNDDNQK
jgi:hypothetical protein